MTTLHTYMPCQMPKRTTCQNCDRPAKTCICDAMVTMDCAYQLIILQDPREARHALSSAPLLAKSVQSARLMVGEVFDPDVIIGADWRSCALLIFPSEQSMPASAVREGRINTLILLDGTWRKVSRLLHLNPWLRELPQFAIQPDQPSAYTIRKSPRADGLSTIEAAVYALNALQPDSDFSSILAAFHKMIELQIAAMGKDTFQKNYADR